MANFLDLLKQRQDQDTDPETQAVRQLWGQDNAQQLSEPTPLMADLPEASKTTEQQIKAPEVPAGNPIFRFSKDKTDLNSTPTDWMKDLPATPSDNQKFKDIYNRLLKDANTNSTLRRYDYKTGEYTDRPMSKDELDQIEKKALAEFDALKKKETEDQKAFEIKTKPDMAPVEDYQKKVAEYQARGLAAPEMSQEVKDLLERAKVSSAANAQGAPAVSVTGDPVIDRAIATQTSAPGLNPAVSNLVNKLSPGTSVATGIRVKGRIPGPQAPSADVLPATPRAPMNSGYSPELSSNVLKQLLADRRSGAAAALIARGGAQIGAALSRTKPDMTAADNIEKLAGMPVEDFEKMRSASDQELKHEKMVLDMADDKAKADPTSAVSRLAQKLVNEMQPGIKGVENMSAADIDKLIAPVTSLYNAHENRMARSYDLAMRRMDRHDQQQLRDDARYEREAAALAKLLDASRANSRSALGLGGRSLDQIERGLALLEKRAFLTPQEQAELAGTLDAVLTGGSPTVSRTKELLQRTFGGDTAKALQYFTGSPHSNRSMELAKRIAETLHTEKNTINRTQYEHNQKALGGYSNLKNARPELYRAAVDPFIQLGEDLNPVGFERQYNQKTDDNVTIQLPDGRTVSGPSKNAQAILDAMPGAKVIK